MNIQYDLVVILLLSTETCIAARILGIYTIGARSTFAYHTRMLETLVRRGHEVTIISPFSRSDSLPNCTLIDFANKPGDFVDALTIQENPESSFMILWYTYELQHGNCERMYANDRVRQLLQFEKFDLVLLESAAFYCFTPLAFAFGAPVVGIGTGCTLYPDVDYDFSPATVPTLLGGFSTAMDFYQRVGNTLSYVIHWGFRIVYSYKGNAIVRKYLADAPSIEQVADNISLFFLNSHASILSRPAAPNKVFIGGIHIHDSPSLLPAELEDFISSSAGTIYVSFGSVVRFSSMPTNQHDAFVRVLSSLPYRVVWRHDRPEMVDNSSRNILVGYWFPQASILAADKVLMFVSHCGIMGTYEAIYFGKPLLCIPVDFDQFTNAALVQQLGVGAQLDYRVIDDQLLRSSIEETANNKQLRMNMQELSSRFKDRPMTPADTFAYWVEYVIRNGNTDHLQPAHVNIPFYQSLCLDIAVFAIVVCILVLWLLRLTFLTCLCCLFKRRVEKEKVT